MRHTRSSEHLRTIVGIGRLLDAREDQLEREGAVISAMQNRFAHNHPIRSFFWRRPWNSTAPIPKLNQYGISTYLRELFSWLRFAHDCTDPSVGCSCRPSYRFPNPEKVEEAN